MSVGRLPTYVSFQANNLDHLYQTIASSNETYVAIDTETTSLSWITGKAFGVAIAWEDKAIFIRNDDFGVDNIGRFLCALFLLNKTFVFHNAEFDIHIMRETYNAPMPSNIIDTLRVAHLLDSAAPHGLKDWATAVFGEAASYTENMLNLYKAEYGISAYDLIDPVFLDPYACMDVVLTKALAGMFVDVVKREHPTLFAIEHKLIPVLIDMEKNGIKIDLDYIEKMHIDILGEKRSIEEKLYKLTGKNIEVSSPDKVGKYLYDELKIMSGVKTAKDKSSTSEKALKLIKHDIGTPFVQQVLKWRELEKIDSTYLKPYLKISSPHGRIHPHWNATGTITGRFSCNNPNLQNIPASHSVRRMFIPDTEFFDFDFSQIELKLMAHASDDKDLIDQFINGQDLHSATASLIFNMPINTIDKDSKERKIGKQLNFGVIYGMGSETFAETVNITQEEAALYLNQYWSAHPKIRKYYYTMVGKANKDGYVKTFFGRKIPVFNNPYAAPNYVIQGTAGDIIKISLLKTWEYIKSIGGSIRNTVHDQILFDNVDEDAVPKIKEIMEDYNFSMPITVDMKRSKKSWGDLE